MKYLFALSLLLVYRIGVAQRSMLTTDSTIIMPTVEFDAKGELKIAASAGSSQNDFDFLVGKWKMYQRRLDRRLENCKDWTEFESMDENSKILAGLGDIDTYKTTEMPGMVGVPFEGFTLRIFNPKTRLWGLYWVASNRGILDPPQIGSFEDNVGHFFAKDTCKGKNVIVVFRWDIRDKDKPVWSQAYSADNGKTWEWNWYNVCIRRQKS
jgi:hypothetical protein